MSTPRHQTGRGAWVKSSKDMKALPATSGCGDALPQVPEMATTDSLSVVERPWPVKGPKKQSWQAVGRRRASGHGF